MLTLTKPFANSRMGLDIDETSPGVVTVCEIVPGSLAAQAGLCVGDVLVKVAGRPVGTTDAAADLLSEAVGPIRLDVRSAVPPPVATAPAQPAPAQDVADPFGPVRTEPTVVLPSKE